MTPSSKTAWLMSAPPRVPWPKTGPTSVNSLVPQPVFTLICVHLFNFYQRRTSLGSAPFFVQVKVASSMVSLSNNFDISYSLTISISLFFLYFDIMDFMTKTSSSGWWAGWPPIKYMEDLLMRGTFSLSSTMRPSAVQAQKSLQYIYIF